MTYRKALDKMDRILEQNLLYDFYGELLTEHQQRVYEDAVYNDMSLSEIAGEQGISRQGVHDLIKRCDRILQDYESKLHLVERFMAAKVTVCHSVDSNMMTVRGGASVIILSQHFMKMRKEIL